MNISNVFETKNAKLISGFILLLCVSFAFGKQADKTKNIEKEFFQVLSSNNFAEVLQSLKKIEQTWDATYVPLAIETLAYTRSGAASDELIGLLERESGEKFGRDIHAWYSWMWNNEEKITQGYADFKRSFIKALTLNLRNTLKTDSQPRESDSTKSVGEAFAKMAFHRYATRR